MTPRSPIVAAGLTLAVAFAGGACGTAGTDGTATSPAGPESPSVGPVTAPDPTPVPGASGGFAPFPGAGDPGAGGGIGDPGPGPSLVVPVPGVREPHPVTPTALEVRVDDGNLIALVTWWSGVEPCTALAGVDVALDGTRYRLTVLEGSAAGPDTACIDLAVEKATLVALGPAAPGTWTVDAGGEAGEVTVTLD